VCCCSSAAKPVRHTPLWTFFPASLDDPAVPTAARAARYGDPAWARFAAERRPGGRQGLGRRPVRRRAQGYATEGCAAVVGGSVTGIGSGGDVSTWLERVGLDVTDVFLTREDDVLAKVEAS